MHLKKKKISVTDVLVISLPSLPRTVNCQLCKALHGACCYFCHLKPGDGKDYENERNEQE